MDIKDVFAKNLSGLRQNAGMTQLELGDKLNYSDKTVSKWERGESMPDAGMLKQIAELFGVSVDYLLEEDHNKQQSWTAEPADHMSDDLYRIHQTIRRIAISGVWALSVLVLVIAWAVTRKVYWLILVWTLPIVLLLSVIFTSLWSRNKGRDNFIFISLFIFSIFLAIYLSVLSYNVWMLFLVMVPVEILLAFCFKLYFTKRGKAFPSGKPLEEKTKAPEKGA